ALRDVVIPDLLERNRTTRRLRIWSAGCSFGAEPYSLSILLKRELAHLVAGWDISILATDINREFLSRARAGCFEDWAFRGVADDLKRACFSPAGNLWRVNPEFREGVTFQPHNLVEHPFPSLVQNLFAFDLVLCRNVMIYFNREVTDRVVAHLHDALVPGGWLLVGHAEPSIETFRAFKMFGAPGAVLYQKHDQSAPAACLRVDHRRLNDLPRRPPLATVERVVRPRCETTAVASMAVVGRSRSEAPTECDRAAKLTELRMLADVGRLEQALVCCEQMLGCDKLQPAIHFYHALILTQLGRGDDATLALRRAVYLDRTYVLAHYYLGLAAQQQNRAALAARSFRNVLELLAGRNANEAIADADDLRAGDLERLTRFHLAAITDSRSASSLARTIP
ncbi:MAG TPA: CheR family methyltransferase, partial [Pirellulales bacterium]|nr:CheR family methyltransferase [Pirellulales bacterium]